jgi:hypothetical protein
MTGFGLRVIAIALKHEGKERTELLGIGLGAILFGGGFFFFQLIRVIARF